MAGFFRAPEHMREEIRVSRECGEMSRQMTTTRRSKGIIRAQVRMKLAMSLNDCGESTGAGVCGESL